MARMKKSVLHDMIFGKEGVPNKNGGEGGAGDVHKTATPVTNSIAAIRSANAQPSYAPAYSQDLVANLANQYSAGMHLDNGFTPSPFGATFPDLQRDASEPPDPKDYLANPNAQPQTYQVDSNTREVILEPNYSNAYMVRGRINGKEVEFLLDTGATQVSIPQRIADYIGLQPQGGAMRVRTASGVVMMHETILDTLSIGEIELRHVQAVINPSDRSETILLGMSALRKLDFAHVDGKLILRQKK